MNKIVMAVDDSKTVREVLSMTLEKEGYQVIVAKDGLDALEKYPAGGVDMLVTDLNMPHMDGLELIKTVRQKPGSRFTPIIMLTTEAQPEKRQEGKKAGASGWITKPFRPEKLLSITRTVCPA